MKFNSLTNHWSPIAFMPGELSLSMPAPPLPSADREAIIALLTGNWRALLDSAISSASQQLRSMVPDPMIMDADDPRRTENKALFDECDHNASSTYQGRVTAAEDARDGRWEGDAVGVVGACGVELWTGPGELVACPVTAGLGLAHAGYAQWRYREQVREAQLNYQADVDRCFVKYGK